MTSKHVIARKKEMARQRQVTGKRVIARIKEMAKQQQTNCYTDSPGYNDHSGG